MLLVTGVEDVMATVAAVTTNRRRRSKSRPQTTTSSPRTQSSTSRTWSKKQSPAARRSAHPAKLRPPTAPPTLLSTAAKAASTVSSLPPPEEAITRRPPSSTTSPARAKTATTPMPPNQVAGSGAAKSRRKISRPLAPAVSITAIEAASEDAGGVGALDAGGVVVVFMRVVHKGREVAPALGGEGFVVGAVGLSRPRREGRDVLLQSYVQGNVLERIQTEREGKEEWEITVVCVSSACNNTRFHGASSQPGPASKARNRKRI